jgi:hypothetical protein
MPGLWPGIHILAAATKDMDGRASPTMTSTVLAFRVRVANIRR